MEILNFNFFSIGWLSAVAFYCVSAIFCFSIQSRSRAALHLGLAFALAGISSFAYFLSASFYTPIMAVHRYFTISLIMGTMVHTTQFFFAFPDDDYRKIRHIMLIAMWSVVIAITAYFIVESVSAGYQYHFLGHYWDFNLDELSKYIGYLILVYILITIGTGIWRFIITKGRIRWVVLTLAVAVAVLAVIPAIANILSRDGAISREAYLLLLDFLTVIGYFSILIIFINNTRDRTTFMTKVIGICLVFFLVILLGISYYASNVNERSYDFIHQYEARFGTGENVPRPKDMKYMARYSLSDNAIELVSGEAAAAPDLAGQEYEYLNSSYYSEIRDLDASNFGTELPGILVQTHPYFNGYKNDLVEFMSTMAPSGQDPIGTILNHIADVNKLTLYYTNKIKALPAGDFRKNLTQMLGTTKAAFGNFKIVMDKHLAATKDDGEQLRTEVLKFLAPFQSPETRRYMIGRDGKSHYISFLHYDQTANAVYDIGFSYLLYRKYIHPDSALLVILLIVVILVISVAFRFFFLGTLIHPLNNVLDGMRELQKGNLDVNIPIKVEDEIGFISHNFNEMVWAMAADRKKLDDYALHLEEKVEQRTQELKKANDELAAAMGVMEAMNDDLITTNKDLKEAERIASLDMAMAANVQSSYFPKEPPAAEDWEITFLFKPMSGISGDMYDFYEENGKIIGLSLFDVSGHGIASGLITMLAKSVIFRKFMDMQQYKLHEIIESVNEDLIQEIGKVDNYLTGIILRFSGNKVEFVNAGHTDPLFFDSRQQKVKVVDLKDRSIKGMFLGIEILKGAFSSLSFPMNADDMLLLYTDCLMESKNKSNEEFGMKRIVQGMKEFAEMKPRVIIERMVRDLYDHIGTDKLTDDLTIILIKRLS